MAVQCLFEWRRRKNIVERGEKRKTAVVATVDVGVGDCASWEKERKGKKMAKP